VGNTAWALIVGSASAGLYFWDSERGVPRESNCSYLAPWTTDLLAWAAGGALVWLGHKHGSFWVSAIGATIASLHLAQWAVHKAGRRHPAAAIAAREAGTADCDDCAEGLPCPDSLFLEAA